MSRSTGVQLARARRAAGLTQAQIAERMGTTQSAVARAESGGAGQSSDFIERYARATGRPITIVFGGPTDADRQARVRRALGGFTFDPWERDPSPVEVRALEAQGLRRGRG